MPFFDENKIFSVFHNSTQQARTAQAHTSKHTSAMSYEDFQTHLKRYCWVDARAALCELAPHTELLTRCARHSHTVARPLLTIAPTTQRSR